MESLPLFPQLSQAVLPASSVLLGTALLLGVRHGVDWDHIAAITDIASTTTSDELGAESHHRSLTFGRGERRALWLSLLYALGHASVVILLGIAAISFSALLPEWIDPLMQRIVGLTLVLLGLWVLFSLIQALRGGTEFRLRSRWMVTFTVARHAVGHLRAWAGNRAHVHHRGPLPANQYGARTAYGVGMIHGIGAETGSQALLIAAVGGAAGQGLGVPMLLAFTLGLVISNTAIAVLASTSFVSSAHARPLYLLVGGFTGVFSLAIGIPFLVGDGLDLPDLGSLLPFLGDLAP